MKPRKSAVHRPRAAWVYRITRLLTRWAYSSACRLPARSIWVFVAAPVGLLSARRKKSLQNESSSQPDTSP